MTKKHISLRAQDGFSLIELAIVMVIMGLLTVPLLQRYQVYAEQERRDKTSMAFSSIHEALGAYFMEHGYYPCPADRSIAFNTTGHGEAVADCTADVAIGTCSSGNGLCHGNGTGGGAMTGGIPYVTLKLPYDDTIDGYKGFVGYTVSDEFVNTARAYDDTRKGTLTLEDNSGGTATVLDEQIYGLISYGENRKGAFNIYGKQIACDAGTADDVNCNNDADFVRAPMSLANGADYFDDVVSFTSEFPSALWKLDGDNIYNTNPGAVGIGTSAPAADVKLEVVGDIRAEKFRAGEFCDENGTNCMSTEVIAGDITKCDEPGQYLYGVVNNQPVCKDMAIKNVKVQNCPSGQYVVGIKSNGDLTCQPF